MSVYKNHQNHIENNQKRMFSLNTNKSHLLRQPPLEIIFCIFAFCIVGYLLFYGYLYKLAFIVLLGGCVFIALRFPLLTVFLLIIFAVLPTTFQMIPDYSEEWMRVGFGIRIQDVVMVSMVGAVFFKVIFRGKKLSERNNLSLSVYIILFGLWISFEIVRNISLYGLSAPGEFRYRYLILSAPLYITLFFSSTEKRQKLLKLLIVSSLFFPIMCVPIIGQLKGWSIGPDARFFPASISLGLLYGLLALSLGKKYRIIKINEILYWLIFVISGLMILIDSHRSVWIATFAVGAALFWIKEINYIKRMNRTLLTILSIIIILTLTNQILISKTETNLIDYITGRTSDLVKLDESYNNTASWRLLQWKEQMTKFYYSPIIGEGFGSYWGFSGDPGDLGIQPHNLYVQKLVKLGGVGMLLYLIIIVKIFVNLKRRLANNKLKSDPNACIIAIGFVILVASHIFYIAYSFEYYSLLFIGLGVACSSRRKEIFYECFITTQIFLSLYLSIIENTSPEIVSSRCESRHFRILQL